MDHFGKVHFKKWFKSTLTSLTYLNLGAFQLNFPDFYQLISLNKTQKSNFLSLSCLNWRLGLEMTAKKQKEMAENLVKLVARKNHFIQKTIFWALTFDVLKNLWRPFIIKVSKIKF